MFSISMSAQCVEVEKVAPVVNESILNLRTIGFSTTTMTTAWNKAGYE